MIIRYLDPAGKDRGAYTVSVLYVWPEWLLAHIT